MDSLKIVFLDRDTIEKSIEIARPSFAHQWREYAQTPANRILERLDDVDIAITNKVAITAQHLDALPELKFIACLLYTSPSPRDQRGSRMPSSA